MAYSAKQKQKIFDDICDLIVNGMSLRKALLNCNNLPAKTFFVWLRDDEFKGKQYARATQERAELIFEDILDIADERPERMDTKNGTCIDAGYVQDKGVRIGARQWVLGKMAPKKYGTTPDHEDKNDDNEIIINIIDATK